MKKWRKNNLFFMISIVKHLLFLYDRFLSTGNNGSKLWDKVHKNCIFKFYDQLKGSLGGHCIKENFIQNIFTNFRKLRKKLKNFFIHGWVTLENLFTKCAYDYPICKLLNSFTERVLRMVDVHKCNKLS